jgi:NDP-4-keto-2,6-dideoxyhexose 3-C-methyltransferase
MPTMLRKNAYDTVCHEQLEYYSLEQVYWMAKRCGLKVIDVETNDVNGGSFSVVATKTGSSHLESPSVSKAIAEERAENLNALILLRHV